MENNRFKKLLNRETGNLTEQDAELFQPQQPQESQQPQSREELIESLKSFKPQIEEGDTTTQANNPRNWLAGKVNPMLQNVLGKDTSIQIPTMTVADEKEWAANLPENMAGAAMGSIGKVGQGFGKVNVIETAADRIAAKNKANGFGSVKVIDSASDKIRAAQQSKFNEGAANRILDEAATKNRFQELFGKEFAERKAAASKVIKDSGNLRSVVDEQLQRLDSFKQEMMDKIIRGEK